MSFDITKSGLPAQINIGPFPQKVVFKAINAGPDRIAFGEYNWKEQELIFQPKQGSKEFAADTVLHEVLHGVWRVGGLPCNEWKHEEKIITVLATGLLQVLRDNPLLGTWLLKHSAP